MNLPKKTRQEREAELRQMLNDPNSRRELEKLFLVYTGAVAPVGSSLIQTILDHEFDRGGSTR